LEELRAFTDRFMRQRNQASLDEFHGLSPEWMHRILVFPFDSPELVTYAPLVAPDSSAPILTLFGLFAFGGVHGESNRRRVPLCEDTPLSSVRWHLPVPVR
jgi:hypothetical protein